MSTTEEPTPTSDLNAINVELGGVELLAEVPPLWEALFDHQVESGAAGLTAQLREDTWSLRLARYERIFERQPAFVMVARQGSQAIGFVLAYADEPLDEESEAPIVTIESLAVLPEMRGQGLGGWLLEEAEEEAIEQWGANVSALEVMVGNELAEGFTKRAGFIDFGETWLRPAANGASVGSTADIDDDRLGELLEVESELFAFGLEEGPDESWQTSVVIVGCQPGADLPADGPALEAALVQFAAAGATSALVALDASNDPAWADVLTGMGFKKVLRLLTRDIVVS